MIFKTNSNFAISIGFFVKFTVATLALSQLSGCGDKKNEPAASEVGNEVVTQPPAPKLEQPASNLDQKAQSEKFLSQSGNVRAFIKTWLRGPQVSKGDETKNDLVIEFEKENGDVISNLEVQKITPDMKIHGHGVPKPFRPTFVLEKNETILLKVNNLGLIMSGPWELNIQFSIDNILDTIEVKFNVP
jgi:hypothetical protein